MAETRRKKQAARLHGRVEEISEILKLLGNPQRLLIASLLCEGEYAVSEIEEKLGIRQPTLSQQLGALREAGVIEGRREAKAVIYHLADEQTRHLLDALHRIFLSRGTGGAGGADVPTAACRLVGGRCVLRSRRHARRPVTVEDVKAVAKGSKPYPSHRFPNRSVPIRPPHADPRLKTAEAVA